MEDINRRQLNILYQCDNRFAFMVGVSMTSLLANADKDIYYHIFFIASALSTENIKIGRASCRERV